MIHEKQAIFIPQCNTEIAEWKKDATQAICMCKFTVQIGNQHQTMDDFLAITTITTQLIKLETENQKHPLGKKAK